MLKERGKHCFAFRALIHSVSRHLLQGDANNRCTSPMSCWPGAANSAGKCVIDPLRSAGPLVVAGEIIVTPPIQVSSSAIATRTSALPVRLSLPMSFGYNSELLALAGACTGCGVISVVAAARRCAGSMAPALLPDSTLAHTRCRRASAGCFRRGS